MSDSPYRLTSADRRDCAALRQLRAAVFEKREALGFEPPPSPDDRAAVDSTLLRGLLALTLRHPIRIITEQPATQFEDFEAFFSHLSETYPEEITELQHIWARAWRRWFNRYHHDEHHPALDYMRDYVFLKTWLGG